MKEEKEEKKPEVKPKTTTVELPKIDPTIALKEEIKTQEGEIKSLEAHIKALKEDNFDLEAEIIELKSKSKERPSVLNDVLREDP